MTQPIVAGTRVDAVLPVSRRAAAGPLWQDHNLVFASTAADARGTSAASPAASSRSAPSPALAPRLAACYKIAMAISMGYMLVTML